MIIVLKPSATEEQITKFTNMLKESYDVKVNKWDGVHSTVLGLIGDTTKIDIEYIDAQDIVENDCIVGVELSVSLFVRLLNSLYIFNNVLSVNILNVNLCCIADKTEYG